MWEDWRRVLIVRRACLSFVKREEGVWVRKGRSFWERESNASPGD